MTDVIETFYNIYPYPNIQKYKEYNMEVLYDKILPPSDKYIDKTICIAGCGTLQPFLIAKTHPRSQVIAIDVSKRSIEIAKNLCDEYNISNIKFVLSEFESIKENYDVIVATGVMHHTKNISHFLNVCYDNLNMEGSLKGFVYYIKGRKDIRELNKFFNDNNYSVSDVKRYFKDNPNDFFNAQNKEDEEIADVWLNPRFKEYDCQSLYEEFAATKWKDSKIIFHTVGDIKLYFEVIKSAVY